jgi:hypothetical protein
MARRLAHEAAGCISGTGVALKVEKVQAVGVV